MKVKEPMISNNCTILDKVFLAIPALKPEEMNQLTNVQSQWFAIEVEVSFIHNILLDKFFSSVNRSDKFVFLLEVRNANEVAKDEHQGLLLESNEYDLILTCTFCVCSYVTVCNFTT